MATQADISQAVKTRPRLMPACSNISPLATIPMKVSPVNMGDGRMEGSAPVRTRAICQTTTMATAA